MSDPQWLNFCELLHAALVQSLQDVSRVTAVVDKLQAQNSFLESCFCKGSVLPVVDRVTTRFLTEKFHADRHTISQTLRCEGFQTPMYDCSADQCPAPLN